jgi:hypothetical protein
VSARGGFRALGFAALAAAAGCTTPDGSFAVPRPDPVTFEQKAYPILLADCAYGGCHGDPERFFSVYGPGRTRLVAGTPPYDPATAEELAISYARASSMLLSPDGVRRGPLLRKPLAVAAGGAGHRGDDPWGSAIYATKRDPRWEALFFWAITAEAAP